MEEIDDATQAEVDETVERIAWAICQEDRPEELARLAVTETDMGTVDGKIEKTRSILRSTVDDLQDEQSVGIRNRDEETGVVEIAKPVGVVGALTPSTNPVGTPAFLAMLAVKGRNAIVVSPSPLAAETCEAVIGDVQDALEACGFPRTLVQMLPRPITKDRSFELVERVDLAQVTGSPSNVRAGEESGTPNYCVGEGNNIAIVDPSADLESAVEAIHHAGAFDNGLPCTSTSNVLVPKSISDELIAELETAGAYVCTGTETAALRNALFTDGHLRRDLVGQSVASIAAAAGLSREAQAASLLVPVVDRVGEEEPLSGEKLSPVVTLHELDAIEAAGHVANRILRYEGRGHSCVVYTSESDRAVKIGEQVEVCRVGVNQSSMALAASFQNGIRATYSLGGGTWAGNQLDENLSYEQFITSTRVFRPIDRSDPSDRALFDLAPEGSLASVSDD
jgi:sulfoacetaldehyde dehydrogenase